MAITALPTPPTRSDPSTFAARGDTFLAALPTFATEANALQTDVNSKQSTASAAATTATTKAGEASTSASNAATSESNALTYKNAASASQSNAATSASNAGTIAASVLTYTNIAATSANASSVAADKAIAAWGASMYPAETLPSFSLNMHKGVVVKSIIYETSRDSDGGAWRKRCTDKSWYTEALGGTVWLGQQPSETVARAYAGAQGSPELVSNGTFSSDAAGWTAQGGAVLTVSAGSLVITNGATSYGEAYQAIATQVGKTYIISNSFVSAAGGALSSSSVNIGSTSSIAYDIRANGVLGTTYTFVATSTTTYIKFGGGTNTMGASWTVDNISVKVVDPTIDVSNYFYQSTADGKYYRCNGNLLGYSEQFDNAGWVATSASVIANAATSPDGTTTADTIIPSAASSDHYIRGTLSAYAGATTTASVYAKANGYNFLRLLIGGSGWNGYCAFDLSNGIVGTSAFNSAVSATGSIQAVGNGWYRCSITVVPTSASTPTNLQVSVNNSIASNDSTFTANGTSGIYIWGAQLELGSVANSYKPTTGAAPGSQTEVFRGNAREFPEQVAIVAEVNRVVIYDLTQVGCPMWMSFVDGGTTGSIGWSSGGAFAIGAIAAFNSVLVVGRQALGAGVILTFASDDTKLFGSGGNYSLTSSRKIADRNATTSFVATGDGYNIVNATVNDVALTVLDGAPIDPSTQLPVPTIAIASAGGVSVIKDDGTVVNSSDTSSASAIYFDSLKRVRWNLYGTSLACSPVPPLSAGFSPGSSKDYGIGGVYASTQIATPIAISAARATDTAYAGTLGVVRHKPSQSLQNGMVVCITDKYSSGWQIGDSRGAYLADTTAETITASGELVTNGTFTTDTSGWTVSEGDGTFSAAAGVATITYGTAITAYRQYATTVIGKAYVLTASLSSVATANAQMYLGSQSAAALTNGSVTINFTATSTTTQVIVRCAASGSFSIDNISVKLADPDRSVKNKGLALSGSLVKTAVASGAGLVSYSGFSASNYLEAPYDSGLDFGTGDFCVMWWANITSAANNDVMFRRKDPASGTAWFGATTVAGLLNWQNGVNTTTGYTMTAGQWTHICFERVSGVTKCYVNGVATSMSYTDATNYTNVLATLDLASEQARASFLTGSISLFRISATAPSADQIAHIYRTELPLFQANAQCTIAGTSTAVTALAYDDVADTLHVGTSWGRTAFRDLLRVDSEATTTGAVTSLSANQGAVLTGGASSGRFYQPAMLLRDELRRKDEARKALGKVPVFFDFTATASQTAFVLPAGYSAKALYKNGTLMREATTGTYWARSSDGFKETCTLSVGATVSDWVSVMATRNY